MDIHQIPAADAAHDLTSIRSGRDVQLWRLLAVCLVVLAATLRRRWRLFRWRGASGGGNSPAADGADIPGSLGLPIFGETLPFLQALRQNRAWEFVNDRLKRASAAAGFCKTHLFGVPTVIMASASGNKLAFSNPHSSWPSSAVAVVGRHSIFACEHPAAAKRIRQAFASLLTSPDALRRYSPAISAAVCSFVNDLQLSGAAPAFAVRLFPLLKSLTFAVACRLLLGRSRAADHRLLHSLFVPVTKGVFHFPINVPGTPYYRAIRASREIRALIRRWIDESRRAAAGGGGDDVLSRFVSYRDESGRAYREEEIADNILVLLMASHDTTAAAAAMTCKYMAENPAVMEEVYRENEKIMAAAEAGWEEVQKKMKVTWRTVQETLRLQPPLHGSFRKVPQDTPFDGVTIPKSWKIYWTTATHRDPAYFPHPDKFDPSRFEGVGPAPFTFVPFGGGLRMCPGHEFARMEVLFIIHHLVTRFSWTLRDPHERISMDPVTFPVNGLPVLLKPRM